MPRTEGSKLPDLKNMYTHQVKDSFKNQLEHGHFSELIREYETLLTEIRDKPNEAQNPKFEALIQKYKDLGEEYTKLNKHYANYSPSPLIVNLAIFLNAIICFLIYRKLYVLSRWTYYETKAVTSEDLEAIYKAILTPELKELEKSVIETELSSRTVVTATPVSNSWSFLEPLSFFGWSSQPSQSVEARESKALSEQIGLEKLPSSLGLETVAVLPSSSAP